MKMVSDELFMNIYIYYAIFGGNRLAINLLLYGALNFRVHKIIIQLKFCVRSQRRFAFC